MPVIRVDDDVWKELQNRAEPLVDTPNSVLRRLLFQSVKQNPQHEPEPLSTKTIQFPIETLHSAVSYSLIPIPKKYRYYFPGYKIKFKLESGLDTYDTQVTSALDGTPYGDPMGGVRIQGNLGPWFKNIQN